MLIGTTLPQEKKDTIKDEIKSIETQTDNIEIGEAVMVTSQSQSITIESNKIIEIHKNEPKTITSHNGVSLNRGGNNNNYKEFTITYYTSLSDENGGFSGVNCNGDKLKYGMVASNYYKQGTKIYIEGHGIFVVSDKGGNDFNKANRLDMFIPRKSGESNKQYKKRVYNMGIQKVKGYVID